METITAALGPPAAMGEGQGVQTRAPHPFAPLLNMRNLPLSLLVCTLLTACGSDSTQYRVGPDERWHDRKTAEVLHARQGLFTLASDADIDTPPRIVQTRLPEYPIGWARIGITGEVTVEFTVNEQGQAAEFVVQGEPLRDLSWLVIEALKTWQLRPAMKDGVPVPTRARQTFHFSRQW